MKVLQRETVEKIKKLYEFELAEALIIKGCKEGLEINRVEDPGFGEAETVRIKGIRKQYNAFCKENGLSFKSNIDIEKSIWE